MYITNKLRWTPLLGVILVLGLSGCSRSRNPSVVQAQTGDPANANLAPVDQTDAPPAPQGQTDSQAQTYAAAPVTNSSNNCPCNTNTGYNTGYNTNEAYGTSNAQPVYATQPPPPLPAYSQPPCPGEDYIWTPGSWDSGYGGYYWVPGVWVLAPYIGALWTPPYWGFVDGRYLWHAGYWGPHIGFYGGINYGFGYTGRGYYGAYWNNGKVFYNRAVTSVNAAVIHNVYSHGVPAYNTTRVSYNGGRGGINARPIPAEEAARRDPHASPVPAQIEHSRAAAGNRAQFAAANGRPQTLAAARPLATSYRAPAAAPAAAARVMNRTAPETRAQAGVRPGSTAAPQQFQRQPERSEARQSPQRAAVERQPFARARPAPQPRHFEGRPAPQRAAVERQPFAQNRSAPRQPQRFEARPAPQPQRFAARPAQPARPAPAAHQEERRER